MPLQVGDRMGPYEIVGRLGAGGMGEVYRARDTRLERDVAIKVLPEHLHVNETSRHRFAPGGKTGARIPSWGLPARCSSRRGDPLPPTSSAWISPAAKRLSWSRAAGRLDCWLRTISSSPLPEGAFTRLGSAMPQPVPAPASM